MTPVDPAPVQLPPGDSVPRTRIAVVTIHGVGDHLPFETAKFIGDLLANIKDGYGGASQYTPFRETVQRLNVRPVRVVDHPNERLHVETMDSQKAASGPMDAMARASYARAFMPETATANVVTSLDHVFMEGQLREYKGEKPEDTYELLRLEGKRLVAPPSPKPEPTLSKNPHFKPPPPPAPEKLVHVYDMFWGDLSTLSTGFTQIFGELYQVLLHLGNLGANTVKAAAIHFQKGVDGRPGPGANAWKRFDRVQSLAASILAGPIPFFNLYIAALVPAIVLISTMHNRLSTWGDFIVAIGLAALCSIVGSGYLLMKRRGFSFAIYSVAIFAVLVPAAAAVVLLRDNLPDREKIDAFCAVMITALAFGGVGLLIRAYSKRRPGSGKVALILAGVSIATLAILSPWLTFWNAAHYKTLVACFNVIETVFGLLTGSWILFLLLNAAAFVIGWMAVRSVKPGRSSSAERLDPQAALHYDRAVRTWWTARLLLALPSIAFTVLTLMAWSLLIRVGLPYLPCETAAERREQANAPLCPPVRYASVLARIRGGVVKREPISHWIYQTLDDAGLKVLLWVLAAVSFSLLIAGWSLFPVVWDEVSPPRTRDPDDLSRQSDSLGTWLSYGFRFLHLAGHILYWAAFLFLLSTRLHDPTTAHKLTKVLGWLVGGATLTLFGLGARFDKLALGFRPAVRVMLDVDNWLREHPRDFNPRARICGRFVSLLRHVVAWRSEEGEPYQALIIVAHSQGTVITADLLRFLNVEAEANKDGMAGYDPELATLFTEKLPVYLFTMGCPLRQLYGLRFPYLYGWARHGDRDRENHFKPLDIPPSTVPDPDTLGVKLWVNAFRSGDYIGRHLWRADTSHYNWSPPLRPKDDDTWDPPTGRPKFVSSDGNPPKRVEFCIGPGAHTHYWDSTAGSIADMLDRLIALG